LTSTDTSQMEFEVTGHGVPQAFFAYPSEPYALSEAIKLAAQDISKTKVANVRTWEDMSVSGKNVIGEICREINSAQIFCADITGLNPNVMFELGYAIARDKRIWLVFELHEF
jgi:nucleoside 2-deoxyribosyltransferase